MQPPTWSDVRVPDLLVERLRTVPASVFLDLLTHQIVFHNQRKLVSTYHCESCGHAHVPARIEEVAQCPGCGGRRVRCLQSLKFGTEIRIHSYSRTPGLTDGILKQMAWNFSRYFGHAVDRGIDWDWHGGLFRVAFAGGETSSSAAVRLAVSRAAVLTPYLWDGAFDWETTSRSGPVGRLPMTEILFQLTR